MAFYTLSSKKQKNRPLSYPQIESALAIWFNLAVNNHITITTDILKQKARITEKLRPLFIHKHKTPPPLRGIDKSSLAVEYCWNSTAWMQTSIFSDYLKHQ